MSILQFKYCPHCGEKTYHRYKNILRCRFTPETCWECVNCQNRKRNKRWNDDYSAPMPMGD
ncbi:hypothetical protein [Pseudodesulfovibrio sp. zrk46]|uniref:hypothetical protein n=1 Tax=Pseudodesulfovibrio sp. zrk46 TaxID=2725288 RepID=UPI001449ADE6|nr:hypothetical protein [Pseudodesulfovibrio sp. zrk46]QJB55581.1 hypothetical protein HFN16_03850 [Pseudodesulfovibrio sp. zrk46]